jgi:hypothetical protein
MQQVEFDRLEHRLLTGELIEAFPYGETTPISPKFCQRLAENQLGAYWGNEGGRLVPKAIGTSSHPLPELVRVVISGKEMGRCAVTDWQARSTPNRNAD